ncbi:hypothetical protein PV318_00535 [Streptomyces sp. ME02-6991-2B]|nr:hypothetical protein [Streptomyces sp. ME02-6991-2B]
MQSVSPGRPRLRRVRLPGTVSLPALPRTYAGVARAFEMYQVAVAVFAEHPSGS